MKSETSPKKPLFSIITPVHNGGKYFEELIQSIVNQSESSLEHIVIDDGSDDGITQETLKKYPHIKWWSRENKGQYYSMNEGLEKASGQFVCFISADDMMAEGTLAVLKSIITKKPSVEMVWGKGCHIREDGSVYEVQSIFQRHICLHKYLSHVPHSAIYIKREYLLNKNIWFNSNMKFLGDFFWILKLIQSGPVKKYINHVMSYNRIHAGQTTQRMRSQILEERAYYAKDIQRSGMILYVTQSFMTIRSALLRIHYKIKTEGLNSGVNLFISFFKKTL